MIKAQSANGAAIHCLREHDPMSFRDCVDLDSPDHGLPWYVRIDSPETRSVRDAYRFAAMGELSEGEARTLEEAAYHALSERVVEVRHPYAANRNLEDGFRLAPELGR